MIGGTNWAIVVWEWVSEVVLLPPQIERAAYALASRWLCVSLGRLALKNLPLMKNATTASANKPAGVGQLTADMSQVCMAHLFLQPRRR